jgi:anti-anti-sigma factor
LDPIKTIVSPTEETDDGTMDLILEVRTGRRRVTMACHGKLIGGEEGDAFRRSALVLMGAFDKMTINLAGVRSADCGGLGSLASVLAQASEKGKQVRITQASPMLTQMLQSFELQQFLELPVDAAPPMVNGLNAAAVA